MNFASEHRVVLAVGTKYPILVASFRKDALSVNACRAFEDAGWYDKRWEIVVYSVLKVQRHCAKELLTQHGLPRLREWLAQPEAQAWAHGRKRLTFLFDPTLNQISVSESGEVLSE